MNEVTLALSSVQEQHRILAMWQVQDPPPQGQTEARLRLEYGTGGFVQGDLVWSDEIVVPLPGGCDFPFDPTVVPIPEISEVEGGGFLGAAVAECGQENAVFMRTDLGHDQFNPERGGLFPGCVVRNTRVGWTTNPIGPQHVFYLLARSRVPQGCGLEDQVLLRRGVHNPQTDILQWSGAWQPLVNDLEEDVLGYPSRPAYVPPTAGAYHQRGHFSFADEEATYIHAAFTTGEQPTPVFFDSALTVVAVLDTGGGSIFDVSPSKLAGNFQIGPFTSAGVAMCGDDLMMYVVYHDLEEPVDVTEDGDFDVYLKRGVYDDVNNVFIWEPRLELNTGDDGVLSDQFMPVIYVDGLYDLHVAWYDTRNDPKLPGQDVKVSLYYARSTDFGDTWTEVMLDEVAFDTADLINDQFIGDYIDITERPDVQEASAIVVYMGTNPAPVIGQGPEPIDPIEDEAILAVVVD